MIVRHLASCVEEVKKGYPVIVFTGPRQAGKTTLAKHCFKDKPYVSLENPMERHYFEEDPKGFLSRFPDGAILDEVQRCPDLPSYLQEIVDNDSRMGLYILTGSQNFGLMEQISQSLSGRAGLLELLPFSREELAPVGLCPESVDEAIFKGGYPPVYTRTVSPSRWYGDYIATYLERDVRNILNIRDLSAFTTMLSLCAAHVGQQVNMQEWAGICGVDNKTIRSWIGVLEASYLIRLLKPYFRNFKKRMVKTPKLYFYDTGVVCHLLKISEPGHVSHHPLRGALFENWVLTELLKGRYHRGLKDNFYFWRSSDGLEIDFINEHGLTLKPIEVKSGMTARAGLGDALRQWRNLAQDTAEPGVIIYAGNEAITINDCTFIPWNQAGKIGNEL